MARRASYNPAIQHCVLTIRSMEGLHLCVNPLHSSRLIARSMEKAAEILDQAATCNAVLYHSEVKAASCTDLTTSIMACMQAMISHAFAKPCCTSLYHFALIKESEQMTMTRMTNILYISIVALLGTKSAELLIPWPLAGHRQVSSKSNKRCCFGQL